MSADADVDAAPYTHRGAIFLEQCPVLARTDLAADQHLLRVGAAPCAARAEPGTFVYVQCSVAHPTRRPMSIMRANTREGWIDLFYQAKEADGGSGARTQLRPADTLSVLGPVGQGFRLDAARPRVLAVGGGLDIAPMVFLAERLVDAGPFHPLVLLGSELPFPFRARPSSILVPGMPPEAIGCMPLLDAWGVPSRLASLAGLPGCYEGHVTELARRWLASLDASTLSEVQMFASGPTPMLAAAARIAAQFDVPGQVSLGQYMTCAGGDCAGCEVAVRTAGGATTMKRVCVDGPVFDAKLVFD